MAALDWQSEGGEHVEEGQLQGARPLSFKPSCLRSEHFRVYEDHEKNVLI